MVGVDFPSVFSDAVFLVPGVVRKWSARLFLKRGIGSEIQIIGADAPE